MISFARNSSAKGILIHKMPSIFFFDFLVNRHQVDLLNSLYTVEMSILIHATIFLNQETLFTFLALNNGWVAKWHKGQVYCQN